MRKTSAWLITASVLVLIGFALFAVVMSTLEWDFKKLSVTKYETNAFEIGESFDAISIDTDDADIVFALSGDGRCRVECYEDENRKHRAAVESGILSVGTGENTKAWYEYIGFHFDSPKITVYLPNAQYASLQIDAGVGDIDVPDAFVFKNVDISLSTGNVGFFASASETVKIKTSTGAIRVENISAGALDLKASTGEITVLGAACAGDVAVGVSTGKTILSNIRCRNVTSTGSTGDISIENVIAEEKLSVRRSTGDVRFDGSDAAEIIVKTDTGDVKGSLLSDKVFIAQTDTGRVDVPKTTDGGRCEITTDTGDIKIEIARAIIK